jgi:hypothetical protein
MSAACAELVAAGDLYAARRLSLAHCLLSSPHLADGGLWPALAFPAAPRLDESCARACSADWVASTSALFQRADYLAVISRAHARHALPAGSTLHECGSGDDPNAAWLCREVGNRSRSFLCLPALRDVSVRLTLGGASHAPRVLRLDQDGFLRPFDVSTALWPAGYLLARWASDEAQCRRWRRSRLPLLELGAGVGAPSIAAAALCGPGVRAIATDASDSSLALLAANAQLNGVSASVRVVQLDWHSDRDVEHVAAMGPFAAILGAALQPEAWADRMWHVLDRLSSRGALPPLTLREGVARMPLCGGVPCAAAAAAAAARTDGGAPLTAPLESETRPSRSGAEAPTHSVASGCGVAQRATVCKHGVSELTCTERERPAAAGFQHSLSAAGDTGAGKRAAGGQTNLHGVGATPACAGHGSGSEALDNPQGHAFPQPRPVSRKGSDRDDEPPPTPAAQTLPAKACPAATLIALAHSVGGLPHPPAGGAVTELKRMSGLAYGMHTAWSQTEADFELVLLASGAGAKTDC